MKPLKIIADSIAHSLGYDIVRRRDLGNDPFRDIKSLLTTPSPLIFDIGANKGQTTTRFKRVLPACNVHAFEPSPTTFAELQNNVSDKPGVQLWNCALGSSPSRLTFLENSRPRMSSFLPLSRMGGGVIERETEVDVDTVDNFAKQHSIEFIDILKSDTQGYDLEVLKGANDMLENNRIGMIYFEIIFSDMYKNLPRFDEIYAYLTDRGYKLVTFYRFHYQERLAGWTDALFISGKHCATEDHTS